MKLLTLSRPHLWPVLFAYVLATGVFMLVVLALLRAEALDSGAALNHSFAHIIEEQTTRTVESVEALLHLAQNRVKSQLEADSAEPAAMRDAFRRLLEGRPYVRAIWYVDRDGKIQFDSDEGTIGLEVSDRLYFTQYQKNSAPFSLNAPIRSRTNGNWFIPATKPVYAAGGFLGVVVAALETDYLGKVWLDQQPSDNLAVHLMHLDGTLLLRSPLKTEAMGKSFAGHDLFDRHLLARPIGEFTAGGLVDTQSRLFAYRVLSRYQDLVVVVTRAVGHVLAGWWLFVWLTIGGWAASSAALGLFAFLLIREADRRLSVQSNLEQLAAEREAESQVLEMISTGADLPAILEKVTTVVEALASSATASIVLLDSATKQLRQGASPNLPAAYTVALEGLPVGPRAGSCGTAMLLRKQIVVTDIERDPLWDALRDLVRPYGFRTCWSTPIVDADGNALASLALYFRESRRPGEADQRLIGRAVHMVLIAIERSQKDNELRTSAQSLRESEQRFEALTSATFDAIWDRDLKTNTVWRSEGFKAAFGFTDEEVAQHPLLWYRQVHPDDQERIQESLDQALQRKAPNWNDQYRFIHNSGRVLRIAHRARLIYDQDGEPARMIGGMSDVTLMHEAQERIEQLQTSLKTLIDAAKIGILVHQDFRPVLANAELARMFGFGEPAEILAMADCRALFAPEELERISSYNAERKRGGAAPGFYAVKGRKQDGTLIALENRAFSISWEGRMSICAMLVDVTDRLALEEQLRQSQRLEAVGQLTGGVAHDFNNLLQVILGNAEHLAIKLADNDDLRQMVELTRVAAERGATLTSQLLAFSRRQTLAPKAVDIGSTIRNMSALLRRTLGEQVTVDVNVEPSLWQAFIDAPQLENAVLNLCINARDAMPGGGRLTLALDNASLDRAYAEQAGDVEPGDYVVVAVSDTGVGMPPEVLARAFEPFFTTKEVGKGSGLGLSMVLGFIKQSKGHVKIYSEPGHGTSVSLYLPRAMSAEAEPAPQSEETTITGGTERVLLVEDDDLVRAHATALLASLGYDVVAAAHGHEALERLRTGPRFDLLFTDVVMPGGINGRQLAEQARLIQPDLPVLFTSGYTDTAVLRQGPLDPSALIVPKPYRRQDLAWRLREVLGQQIKAH